MFDGDQLDTTMHLGVAASGDIVAISTWMFRPRPGADGGASPGYQLRGMASHPDHRGSGAASAVLTAGIERCRALGVGLVWARARTTALAFYEHHGFEIVGDEYVDATTGLQHRDIAHHLA